MRLSRIARSGFSHAAALAVTASVLRAQSPTRPPTQGPADSTKTHTTKPAYPPDLDPRARRLFDLARRNLTAKDPVAGYVEVECEIEHLSDVYGENSYRLMEKALAFATDPSRDDKSLAGLDSALAYHAFSGCAADRITYHVTRSPPRAKA